MRKPNSSMFRFSLTLVALLFLAVIQALYKFQSTCRFSFVFHDASSVSSSVSSSTNLVTQGEGPSDLSEDLTTLWWMSNLRDTPLRITETSTHRKFVFPQETKKVWVDVGVNKKTGFLPNLQEDESLFLIGFEPSERYKPPCGHKNCVVLWAALTPKFDIVYMNVQRGAHLCNSVFRPNTNTTSKLWKQCVTQKIDKTTGKPKTIQVPGIPLHSLVERIPDHVEVEYIKIDAQGYDLEVMKGAFPSQHGRIQIVSLEAMDVEDEKLLLYQGQKRFHEIKEIMGEKGWTHVESVPTGTLNDEINAFFVSDPKYSLKAKSIASDLKK